jgi:predicted MPP superfamily phosphohydrolase
MAVTILHISDIHLQQEKVKDFREVRKAIIEDAEKLRLESSIVPDLALFSGDLVQAGDKIENFELANAEVIEPILKGFGLGYNQFFMCPGNHDIDRDHVRKNKIVENGRHVD